MKADQSRRCCDDRRVLRDLCRALVFTTLLAGALPAAAAAVYEGPATVSDGDTVKIRGQRIRLYGIDAVESSQGCVHSSGQAWRCGCAGKRILQGIIGRRPLRCEQRDTDHFGRPVAVCYLGTHDLNAHMVRDGWAVAWRRYSMDYVDEERAAIAERRNIHSGRFELPWEYRHRGGKDYVTPCP